MDCIETNRFIYTAIWHDIAGRHNDTPPEMGPAPILSHQLGLITKETHCIKAGISCFNIYKQNIYPFCTGRCTWTILTTKELFFKQSNFYSCIFYTPSSKTLEILCKIWVSEWVIKFNGLSGDSGQPGPYSPCNHSLQIGIIIFPHIDTHNMRLKHDADAQQCEIILMFIWKSVHCRFFPNVAKILHLNIWLEMYWQFPNIAYCQLQQMGEHPISHG